MINQDLVNIASVRAELGPVRPRMVITVIEGELRILADYLMISALLHC